jgi:shikimate kinase
MTIVLIGMKHCGKSTVGGALAVRRGCPFHDLDDLIVTEHERRTGRRHTVREIYKTHGAAEFARLETTALHDLAGAMAASGTDHVVALGGRTPMNPDVQTVLAEMDLKIYLRVSTETLFERVRRTGIPPFLDAADPAGSFAALCDERTPYYEQLADIVLDAEGHSVDEIVDRITHSIKEHPHGR